VAVYGPLDLIIKRSVLQGFVVGLSATPWSVLLKCHATDQERNILEKITQRIGSLLGCSSGHAVMEQAEQE
jgi:hypothetical protein